MNEIIDLPDVELICFKLIEFIKDDFDASVNCGNEDMLRYDSTEHIFKQFKKEYLQNIL